MALTRAQLLAGDVSTGTPILAGQVQGVRQGIGITILPDGTINFDASTAVGVMRTNNPTAYNGYVWPSGATPPPANTILQSDGTGSLNWTGDYVATVGTNATNAALGAGKLPSGPSGNRPAAAAGLIRYNTSISSLEYNDGTNWLPIASGSFVQQSIPTAPAGATPVAIIPSGTTAERQTAPAVVGGEMRFNVDTDLMEVFDGTSWVPVGAPPTAGLGIDITGSIVKLKMPEAATPPTPGALAGEAIVGSMYYDINLGVLFLYYSNGGTPVWVQIPVSGGGSTVVAATLAEAAAGTLNTVYSSPETAVPKNAAGMTGAAILPGGTTAQQPGGAADGWFRYNSTLKVLEYYTNSAWVPVTFSGGTTGGINTNTAAAAPATRSNGLASVEGDLYWNTATNQYFAYDGTAWVPFDQRRPVVTAVNYTAKPNDYVVVTAATQTITLPATPIAGTVVTVVVAGTFLDTTVARNGSNIMALAQDITLDKQYAAMQFTYTDATNGWRLN